MLFGYARVSTADQNPDHQIDALLRAGVAQDAIYVDRASGAKASRPQLDELLKLLRDGDTLKITRLDRLGRSVLHLVTLGAKLRERGVGLHVIEQGIDTATADGRAMFGMLSVLAELQRELIVANTRDGLAAARGRGRNGGRRPKLNAGQVALAQRLLRRRRTHRAADRRHLQRSTHHGLRPPRQRARASAQARKRRRRCRPPRRRAESSPDQRGWRLVTAFLPAPQRLSPSELQLSLSRVGLEHGVGVPANEVQAAVEMRPPDITHEHLGCSRLRGAKVELQALANPNLPLRRFSITLPAAIPRGALQIAIREHERFQRDDAAPEPAIGRRLVYAETFALPAAP